VKNYFLSSSNNGTSSLSLNSANVHRERVVSGRGMVAGDGRGNGGGMSRRSIAPLCQTCPKYKDDVAFVILAYFQTTLLISATLLYQTKYYIKETVLNMSVFVIRFADLELGDLEGHLPHAAHWDPVAPRREEQEFLLQALAVVLQNL
jgi:hypothetical protein